MDGSRVWPLDVPAAQRAIGAADEAARRAGLGEAEDPYALTPLHEELTGHLLMLVGTVEEDYRDQVPGARLRPVVTGAVRIGGEVLARPGAGSLADVLVVAAVCRTLLTLHQVRDQIGGVRAGRALVEAEEGS